MKIDAFIDIETEDWTTFVCGGITVDGENVAFYWNEDQFAYRILSLEGDVWAWNGGLYDAIWLVDWLERHDIKFECSFAGTRIVCLTIGDLRIRDSVALIPMPLQKASSILGEPISKETGLTCECGKACGGYCRIRVDMAASEKMVLLHYLQIDVVTGWKIMESIFHHAAMAGYELTSTVGGSVWRTMKENLSIGPAEWMTSGDYYQARLGYFGGRVYVGHLLALEGHRSDIHSAYPAALSSVALPFGEYRTVVGDSADKAFNLERPGIYEATVIVPDCAIPPLPWRSECDRIVYPVGIVRGSWTLPELRYALDECGCRLSSIHAAMVWSNCEVLFDSLMTQIFAIRQQFGKENALEAWQKWFANSGTGKFAERPEKERMFGNLKPEEINFCDPLNPLHWEKGCRWGRCSGRCGAMSPLPFDGNLWLKSEWRLSDCAHVQWAAYLTATTRIKWHKAAMRMNDNDGVIYGDTDSLYCFDMLPEDEYGEDLGTFGYEGQMLRWQCIAPKSYRYIARKGSIYHVVCRGKGIPDIDAERWSAFASGETVLYERGVMGLKSAARLNRPGVRLFTRKRVERRHHGKAEAGYYIGDRRILDGGRTRPITVDEQRERERK